MASSASHSRTSPIWDRCVTLPFRERSILSAHRRRPQPPFFLSATSQGSVSSGIFSFKLASEGSELFLGGTNLALYTGEVEFHPVTQVGYWQIGGGSVAANGVTAGSGFDAVIDTGTTIMYGDSNQVGTLYGAIPGAQIYDAGNGFYSYPCDPPPTVTFSWGGQLWAITPEK